MSLEISWLKLPQRITLKGDRAKRSKSFNNQSGVYKKKAGEEKTEISCLCLVDGDVSDFFFTIVNLILLKAGNY